MFFYIFVNGVRIHRSDATGAHEPLEFNTQAEADAAADALFSKQQERLARRAPAMARAIRRSMYVAASQAPLPPEPLQEPPSASTFNSTEPRSRISGADG